MVGTLLFLFRIILSVAVQTSLYHHVTYSFCVDCPVNMCFNYVLCLIILLMPVAKAFVGTCAP